MDENKQEGCLKFILAIIVCGALFAGYVALCVALNWRHAGGTFVFISYFVSYITYIINIFIIYSKNILFVNFINNGLYM